MTKKPFEGVKIVQLCWAGVGVYTLNYLSHYGATTIRVETATRPDPVRLFAPFAPTNKEGEPVGLERSAFFSITHTAPELGISLNFKQPEAIEIFKKLVAWADVVGEGFPTGVMDKLGLDYEGLKQVNPEIIMFRTCGYGHTGPMADQPGFGSILTAVTMMDTITGWPDRPPVPPSTYYTDQLSPMYGSLAIMAALDYKRRTGKGQYIDHAQIEAGLNYMTPLILDYQANGRELDLKGNKCDYAAPHGIYRCRGDDRWCAITVSSDEEWRRFCRALGNPSWTEDSRFAALSRRLKNADELDRLVEAWTLGHSVEEVMSLLQRHGVAAGVVQNASDLASDPQLKARGFSIELDHPELGKTVSDATPIKMSATPARYRRAAPTPGQDNDDIYHRLLGMSEDETRRLKQLGVI